MAFACKTTEAEDTNDSEAKFFGDQSNQAVFLKNAGKIFEGTTLLVSAPFGANEEITSDRGMPKCYVMISPENTSNHKAYLELYTGKSLEGAVFSKTFKGRVGTVYWDNLTKPFPLFDAVGRLKSDQFKIGYNKQNLVLSEDEHFNGPFSKSRMRCDDLKEVPKNEIDLAMASERAPFPGKGVTKAELEARGLAPCAQLMEDKAVSRINFWNPPPVYLVKSIYDIKENGQADGSTIWYYSVRYSKTNPRLEETEGNEVSFRFKTTFNPEKQRCETDGQPEWAGGVRMFQN